MGPGLRTCVRMYICACYISSASAPDLKSTLLAYSRAACLCPLSCVKLAIAHRPPCSDFRLASVVRRDSQSHRTSTQVVARACRRRRGGAGSARHIHSSHAVTRARHKMIDIVPVPPRAPLQVYHTAFLMMSARYHRGSWFT